MVELTTATSAEVGRGEDALVPSSAQVLALLDSVKSIDEMHSLHEQVAAWEGVQRRMCAATEEIIRIATLRLRLERKMGIYLRHAVRRGGCGSKSRSATSTRGGSSAGLPPTINKHRARWYRLLAMVPESVFECYVTNSAQRGRPPTTRGLLRFVRSNDDEHAPQPRSDERSRERVMIALLRPVLAEAIKRFMQVSVLVGTASDHWPQARLVTECGDLTDRVLMNAPTRAEEWLAAATAARSAGRVIEVLAVLPASTGSGWFAMLIHHGWYCCFVRGGPHTLLAYLGERTHAFKITLGSVGTMLRVW